MRPTQRLNRRHILKLGLIPVVAAAATACGSPENWFTDEEDSGSSGAGSTPTPEPTATPDPTATPADMPAIDHPTGADDLVLRLDLTGGFVPVEYFLTALPPVSIYGDGRIITEGPQIAIFPPPALPNLRQSTVTEEGLQLILREAEAAGLLDGDASYDDLTNYIADVGTTVFTTNAGGVSTIVSAYALEVTDALDMIEPENRDAWTKLVNFDSYLRSLPLNLPREVLIESEEPYGIERLQIITNPIDPAASSELDEGGEMDWPLATPLAEIGKPHDILGRDDVRCFITEGQDLAELLPILEEANQGVRWLSGGGKYLLHIRPLLPDEEGCE